MIYQDQMATTVAEGQLSDKIKLGRGVRQGCPLSPLLFDMVLLKPFKIMVKLSLYGFNM